jgi:hypothetical protein
LSHELPSVKLQYLGIAAAMRGFCREFGEQQEVEIDFHTHDLPTRCRRTFLYASYFKKRSITQQNTAGYGTSKCNCGERQMRFISRSAIPARALIAKRQRPAEVWALSPWSSG